MHGMAEIDGIANALAQFTDDDLEHPACSPTSTMPAIGSNTAAAD
jgi:hypothetical protein